MTPAEPNLLPKPSDVSAAPSLPPVNRRIAQAGLIVAALILASCFGILISAASGNASTPPALTATH